MTDARQRCAQVNAALGVALAKALAESGMSMKDYARQCGVSLGHVSNMCRADGHGSFPAWAVVMTEEVTGSQAVIAAVRELAGRGGAAGVVTANDLALDLAAEAQLVGSAESVTAGALAKGEVTAENAREVAEGWRRVMAGARRLRDKAVRVALTRRGAAFKSPARETM